MKLADVMLDGRAAASPSMKWRTAFGWKATPVTVLSMSEPEAVAVQSTTCADTEEPPRIMKWMTYALVSFVVQVRLKFEASHDVRSASASVTSPQRTIVSTLAAWRRLVFVGVTPLWLAPATDLLVVPSVAPNADWELAVNAEFVSPSVQRMSALGTRRRV